MSKSNHQMYKNFAILIVVFFVVGAFFGQNAGQVYTGISATGSDTIELTNNGNLDTKVRDFSLYSSGKWVVNGEEFVYRKLLTLQPGGEALIDYQHKKTITWLDGMQSNMADIRFTILDGTNIPYWEESVTADTEADVWFKVSSISNTEDTHIWMYYGNPDVSSASNGDDTFIQYHGVATATYHDSNIIDPTVSFVWESKAKTITTDKLTRWGIANQALQTGSDAYSMYRWTAAIAGIHAFDDGSSTHQTESMTVADDTFHDWKMIFDGTTLRGYLDGNEIGSGVTTGFPDEYLGLYMAEDTVADEGAGEQLYSFIRRYTATEPTWAADGVEQSPDIIDPGISVGDDELYYDGTLVSILTCSDGSAYIDSSDVSASMKGEIPIIKVGTTQNIKVDHDLEYSITYIPKNMDITSPDMFRAGEDMRVDTRLIDTAGNPTSYQPLEMRIRLFDSNDKLYLDEIVSSTSFVIPGKYLHDNKHYQLGLSYEGYEFGGWSNEVLADFDVGTEGFTITSSPDKAPEGVMAVSFTAVEGLVGMAVTGWLDVPIIGDIIRFIAGLVGVEL